MHTQETSTPNFASTRVDAWRSLGPALPDATTAAEALKFGRLAGWNVRKVPAQVAVGGKTLMIPNRFATVRDNPLVDNQVDVLGDVGKGYQVLQNECYEPLLDTLADESGATFATAGELDGGSKAFITMRMPGHAKVGGVDKVDNYLAVLASHDGSVSTQVMVTPVRLAGQGTLNLAFKKASHKFTLRHTVGAHRAMVLQAQEALEFMFNYLDGFQEQADQLANTKLTQAKFEQLIERNFGAPKGAPAGTVTRTQNKLDHMAEMFSDSFAQQGVGGTAWAGLNALTEWHDHYSPVRPGDGDPGEVRSRKALMDPAFKNDALKLMMGLV